MAIPRINSVYYKRRNQQEILIVSKRYIQLNGIQSRKKKVQPVLWTFIVYILPNSLKYQSSRSACLFSNLELSLPYYISMVYIELCCICCKMQTGNIDISLIKNNEGSI